MVGDVLHMTRFWDIRDDDVFFCTSDIGLGGGAFLHYVCALIAGGDNACFREGAI